MLAGIARKQATDAGLTQENVPFTSIVNVSAIGIGNGGTNNEEVSLYSVSSSDKVSALSTLNSFRRSVQATRMNYVCWESNVAKYADHLSDQCEQSATLPESYDEYTYPLDNAYSYIYISGNQHSVALVLQDAFNKGYGNTFHNMVTKYDLSYMGCGQKKCSRFTLSNGNYYSNAYITDCLLYYTSPVSLFPPYTVGSECSACPSSRTCYEGLCRDYSDFKPALQCNNSPPTMRAISVQSLIVVTILTKWFQGL